MEVNYTKPNLSHPLASIWKGMIRRCYNPKDKAYNYYGAKGVKVCKRWQKIKRKTGNIDGLKNFIEDMYPSYLEATKDGSKVQLDKDILGDGTRYSKDTCCWVKSEDNNQHRSSTKLTRELVQYARKEHKSGRTQVSLAEELGMSKTGMGNVLNYKSWKDVPDIT